MRVENLFWTFGSAIDSKTCDKIIKHGLAQEPVKGMTGKGNVAIDRDSEVVWLYDSWIMDLINPWVARANKDAGWNFQWEPVDALQFTKYEKGQYYGWHRDTFSRPSKDGKIRKLSVTVNLGTMYRGGDMYFDPEEKYGITSPIVNEHLKPTGSICVFPSDIWHKVDKVTDGTRYSLVVWLIGKQWR
tara:strand:+ start:141 stop:701 length:561 start_codon:yes stop_codon:yes gene_type:complete